MKKIFPLLTLVLFTCYQSQAIGANDPYENLNRKIYKFNKAVDATLFKPVAKIYTAILPPQVRTGITNFFNNLQMLPTVANDLLQGKPVVAYKDSWRFFINSTLGVGGLFDVAEKWGLPYKPNDLGITLAKWGDKDSPYFVIPIFGPSTLRDAASLPVNYGAFSVYGYINQTQTVYGLFALNMLEIRAAYLETEPVIDEALDEYTFVRDAYLQNRNYNISGKQPETQDNLYIDGADQPSVDGTDDGALYVDEDEESEAQITKKENKGSE